MHHYFATPTSCLAEPQIIRVATTSTTETCVQIRANSILLQAFLHVNSQTITLLHFNAAIVRHCHCRFLTLIQRICFSQFLTKSWFDSFNNAVSLSCIRRFQATTIKAKHASTASWPIHSSQSQGSVLVDRGQELGFNFDFWFPIPFNYGTNLNAIIFQIYLMEVRTFCRTKHYFLGSEYKTRKVSELWLIPTKTAFLPRHRQIQRLFV